MALKQHLIKAQANPSGKRVVIYIPSYTWHIGITKESQPYSGIYGELKLINHHTKLVYFESKLTRCIVVVPLPWHA